MYCTLYSVSIHAYIYVYFFDIFYKGAFNKKNELCHDYNMQIMISTYYIHSIPYTHKDFLYCIEIKTPKHTYRSCVGVSMEHLGRMTNWKKKINQHYGDMLLG